MKAHLQYSRIGIRTHGVLLIGLCILLCALCAFAVHVRAASEVLGDVNEDGQVNLVDLSVLLSNYDKNAAVYKQGDLNANGRVDAADLAIVSSYYGKIVRNPTTPSTPPIAAAKLRWKSPVMGGPNEIAGGNYKTQTIVVPLSDSSCGGRGSEPLTDTCLNLDANTDYTIILPSTPKYGGLVIRGGHNVVIKGGHLINGSDDFLRAQIRGVFIWDNAASLGRDRTVHIEGLMYEGSLAGKDPVLKTDGIGINAPSAIVQIENVRMTGLIGRSTNYAKDTSGRIYADDNLGQTAGVYSTDKKTYDDGIRTKTLTFWKNEHSDMVQPFGGVKALRIDRLTGDTNCQGLFLRPGGASGHVMGAIELSNINLTLNSPTNCGELLWLTNTDRDATGQYADVCGAGKPLIFSNVWLSGGSTGRNLDQLVYPKSTTATTLARCPAVLTNGGTTLTWPGLGASGNVQRGEPLSGDYVPANVPGVRYVSPGYE